MNAADFKQEISVINQKLFRICNSFLDNRQEAEDALQEVYLKLWRLRDKLNTINNIEAFAVTMTKNLCLDKLKQKRTLSIDDSSLNLINWVSVERSPHQQSENQENVEIINKIISELPDLLKRIIQLRDIEGYEFEEIEKITGLNTNNIRVSLSRARKLVRNELLKMHEFGLQQYYGTPGKIL